MTDKQKLEKIKMLADEMYYRMQNLSTDTSGIRKAMYDYHQFIIYEYYKEEPVSNDLKVALEDYAYQVAYDLSHDWLKENATWDEVETAVKLGAQWQKRQLIDKACEWLRQHMKTLPELLNKDFTKHTLWKRDEIIDKFRQAMEE